MLSAQSVAHLNVNLGPVESTITMVIGPWAAESLKSLSESSFSNIPLLLRAETLLGSSGQLELKLETKDSVDVIEEIETV